MSDLRDETVASFVQLTGRNSDGVWSAPGRVNLIGEHTDYNEGFVLPFAIDRRTIVAAGLREDGVIRVASTFGEGIVELRLTDLPAAQRDHQLTGWAAYPLGVAWALGTFGADLATASGVDLVIDSTVPVGAGLSSSAAIESAVAVALNDLWQLDLQKRDLALAAQRAENDAVGAPTGIMDQSASLLGRRDSAVFLDCRNLESELVDLGFADAGLTILVIDTGVSHSHATGEYRDRRRACESAAASLGIQSLRELGVDDLAGAQRELDPVTFRRVRHVVTENQRVLDAVGALKSGRPANLGELLDASHRSLRDDFEVSTPELDLAVELAVEAGALGARMTGGGFGGSAIALTAIDDVSRVRVAVDAGFAEHGYGSPEAFVVAASDGATRESLGRAR
ncbi:MAG TPA: galactokinase [Galbitalea sp.]|jgi:galactokinase|nr:galactokinase [Galbitalea sp.]